MTCPKCKNDLKHWNRDYTVIGKVPFPFELVKAKVWLCMQCHILIVGDDEADNR